MNSFFRSRSCRCCVCLILVCVLVVSWSPIRAQASALPEVAGVVTKVIPFNPGAGAAAGGAALGSQVFGWVLLGLGLIVTTAQAIDLMNQYTEFTGELETSIYYYPDGSWSYGVDMGFVERVRTFLFDSGYLVHTDPALNFDVYDFPSGSAWPKALLNSINAGHSAVLFKEKMSTFYRCYFFNSSDGIIHVSFVDGRYKVTCTGGTMYYRCEPDYAPSLSPFQTAEGYVPVENTIYWFVSGEPVLDDNVNTDGIEFGYVAPLTVVFPEAYPDWHTNARPATNPETDEEITVLPIPLNPSADPETQIGSLTQPDIWQGALADPMPDTDTNPDTGTDTDPDTQPDSPGAPSTDIGKYQIDLKDFFPFCIPFDLYRFFEILCAEPEAPVFHWEFNVFGEIYSLDVDLSPWNPHAQLFRDAQVGLFIMGLLWITRKFIKW